MKVKVRRIDRAISESAAKEILQKGEYGVLSTVSIDGQPYGVPLSYCYDGEVIYFHSALEGHQIENIRANNRVSFCVIGQTEVVPEKFTTKYESVIVFGKVFEVTEEQKKDQGLLELLKKYSPGYIKEGLQTIEKARSKTRVYKIVVEAMTGKASK